MVRRQVLLLDPDIDEDLRKKSGRELDQDIGVAAWVPGDVHYRFKKRRQRIPCRASDCAHLQADERSIRTPASRSEAHDRGQPRGSVGWGGTATGDGFSASSHRGAGPLGRAGVRQVSLRAGALVGGRVSGGG